MERDPRDVLIKILDTDDQVRGTGFVVEPGGAVLTCHHVIDGLTTVRLVGPAGERCDVLSADALLMPGRDLALLPADRLLAPALAISPIGASVGDTYRSAGFHRLGGQIEDSFPVTGSVTGATRVRYWTAASDYVLPDALVLADDDFDAGLSGAPVTDAEGAVVLGVISTRLVGDRGSGGFGIPLPTNAPDVLLPMLERNDRSVPAFGAHMNTAGLAELCRTQVSAAVRDLSAKRGVDLDRRVDRTGVSAPLAAHTDPGVRALLGPSGIGKSTELAYASGRAELALLLAGSSIPADSRGIEDVIADALGRMGHPVETELLAARAAGRLRIFVDGLNESSLSGRDLRDWLITTDLWCRKADARVVVSCRPESWPTFPAPGFPTLQLAELTDSEAAAAAAVHGLRVSTTLPIVRLPLAVRIAADLQAGSGREQPTTVNALIEEYVRRAAENVAYEVARAASTDTVMRWLTAAATTMLSEGSTHLTADAASRIFPEALLAENHVIRENLMSRTAEGLRFVYDDVADWLASRQIDVPALLALARPVGSAAGSFSYRNIGPLGYALRDIQETEGISAFHARLSSIIEPRSGFGMTAVLLLQETIGKCEPLADHLEFLITFADAYVGSASAAFFTTGFWAGLALAPEDHLMLLRELVRLENYWGWRPGDWSSRPLDSARTSYATVALRIVERDVEQGFDLLRPWFDDRRRLAGGEATVSDVAAGMAFRLRRSAPDALWRLISWLDRRATRLITELSATDPGLVADLVAAVPISDRNSYPFLLALRSIPLSRLDDGRRTAIIDIVSARADDEGLPFDERADLMRILADNTDQQAPLDFLYAGFAAGRIPVWAISDHLFENPDRAMESVRAALYSSAERRNEALFYFRRLSDERIQRAIDAVLLEMLADGLTQLTVPIGDYVGGRLWVVESLDAAAEPALTALIALITDAAPGRSRLGLARALASPDALRGDQPLRRTLARQLLEKGTDPGSAREILKGSAARIRATDFQEELVLAAAHRLDPVDADRVLTSAALVDDDFTEALTRLLATRQLPLLGPRTTRFSALVQSGQTASDAIHVAVLENWD
jgi:hypothetical protein